MLKCLKKEPLMFQLLVHLAINTGCRRGELVALEWNDINFSTGVLTVSKSAYWTMRHAGSPLPTISLKCLYSTSRSRTD